MTMSTTAATEKPGGGCGGDGCDVRDPWPLLNVRHRGNSCRLCTSCVLKYHPGSFCTLCCALVDAGPPATRPPEEAAATSVVHCVKCPSVAHLGCLPNPDQGSQFLCPSCKNPQGFSYFPKEAADGKRRVIDMEGAKALCAAARLSLNSLTRVAVVTRAEAERKVREAVTAKKRARELLEKPIVVSEKEIERNAVAANAAVTLKAAAAAVAVEEPKRKWGKVGPGGGGEQKRGGNRKVEKWMMSREMLPLPAVMTLMGGQVKGDKDRLKAGTQVEVPRRVPSSLGQEEKEKKGNNLSSQNSGVKEEEKGLVGSGEKGPRLPQATQDALVSRTNPRSIFTGSPSTTSLHS